MHKPPLFSGVWLAPMAGATDLAYRQVCKAQGCRVTVTEMVSAKALSFNDDKSVRMLKTAGEVGCKGVQIFGSDAQIMGAMTRRYLNDSDFDFIDINMGCPAPKIVNNGEGSALMNQQALAQRIVASVKAAANKPVSVKIRLGWDHQSINALSFARAMQEAGADALCVHGRTRQQMYSGRADWAIISAIADALSIPVIGNGDIDSPECAKRRLAESGCAAIMIGRAAQGRPWLFKQIDDYLNTGHYAPAPDYASRVALIRAHIAQMLKIKPDFIVALEMRKHVAWYLKGLSASNAIKTKVNCAKTTEDIVRILMQP